MVATQSNIKVVEALVLRCPVRKRSDRICKTLKSSYERRDFVMKAGWATVPTTKEPNREVTEGCAEVLAKAVGN